VPAAFDALQQAVSERPVVMNRAPSLHKLSLMGFNVRLTSGKAIKINPSIVVPYGADFDGDTVWNMTGIVIDLETADRIFEK
jgi:DNA-directed RNA polymerase subunit beta'